MNKTVTELFAGVGGFRVGLNDITEFDNNGRAIENGKWNFVWANQWEPATKLQHAFDCYITRFENCDVSNVDISLVDKNQIPSHTLLVGGFPCQDYSVARSLSKEKGIEGKRGVLWWQINEIIGKKRPPFVLLENVDRLIKSPSKQRGRDYGVMLRCLTNQDYSCEWRVINAADYGGPQRRRRIYIFAYDNKTKYGKTISKLSADMVIDSHGLFAKAFPVEKDCAKANTIQLVKGFKDLLEVSNKFRAAFYASGYMKKGVVYTKKTNPLFEKPIPLSKIVEKEKVDERYFLTPLQEEKFKYLRGGKAIPRTNKEGQKYSYSEGAMSPYDNLNLPGRTTLTSESTTNRSTHIIMDKKEKRLRKLTPVECERLNQFPDNWTNTGMPERTRYFMMGNALVCGVIHRIGEQLSTIIDIE
ncbi:MAG: DNA (cytosine-5-)-methyltransferase [Bacilli bacterium]|jgi:DNA (cytosine-5)-methyltransferase 1